MKQSHTNARVPCSLFQVCLVGINEFGGAELFHLFEIVEPLFKKIQMD